MTKKYGIIVFSLVVCLFLATGCGGSGKKQETQSTAQSSAGEIKIGVIAPLSGPPIGWGYAVQHGAELAADEVNEKGGLEIGGKKYKIKVVAYDDLYTGQGGVAAINRLVFEDKIKLIIGPISSASLLAIQGITEPNKVILMADTYTTKALSKDKQYTFRVVPTTAEFSKPMIAWLAKTYPDAKKVCILSPKDETGTEVQDHNTKAYEAAGMNIVFKDFYERDVKDFVPYLSRAFSKSPDILELDGSSPGTCGLIMKQARQLGFKGIIIKTGGPGAQETIKVAGNENAEGWIYYTPYDPNEPTVKAFIEKYSKKYKDPMNGLTPYFFDGTKMLFKAMQDANDFTDTEKIKAKIEQIRDFPGLLGKINWSGSETYGINHQIITPSYVCQFKNGKETVVSKLD
ncbi:MAG: ABC transporter substrate-binding protein [Firmicutes bacterium]|nr:ABC transporter substrate-binding protein [Bacillota bacterium]